MRLCDSELGGPESLLGEIETSSVSRSLSSDVAKGALPLDAPTRCAACAIVPGS